MFASSLKLTSKCYVIQIVEDFAENQYDHVGVSLDLGTLYYEILYDSKKSIEIYERL
jgi:hypothetical protein